MNIRNEPHDATRRFMVGSMGNRHDDFILYYQRIVLVSNLQVNLLRQTISDLDEQRQESGLLVTRDS